MNIPNKFLSLIVALFLGIVSTANAAKTSEKPKATPLPSFISIKIGTGLATGEEFAKAIEAKGCVLGLDWPEYMMGAAGPTIHGRKIRNQFEISKVPVTLDLVKISPKDLGLDPETRPTVGQVYSAAKKLGLELCPMEAGPQLRMQYIEQPYGEWLHIAMEPITFEYENGLDRRIMLFAVHNNGTLYLIDEDGKPGRWVDRNEQWVFVRPKGK